jgi:hypothetical protein
MQQQQQHERTYKRVNMTPNFPHIMILKCFECMMDPLRSIFSENLTSLRKNRLDASKNE